MEKFIMTTSEATEILDKRTEIKKEIRIFQDKLPEKMHILSILAYVECAEKMVNRYTEDRECSVSEIELSEKVWGGFCTIFEDTCIELSTGREIRELGSKLGADVLNYLCHIKALIRHDPAKNVNDLTWLQNWITELDYSQIADLNEYQSNILRSVQKAIVDIINDVMATAHGYDLNTANSIVVYRDYDLFFNRIFEDYKKRVYMYHMSEKIKGTAFQIETIEENMRIFFYTAKAL